MLAVPGSASPASGGGEDDPGTAVAEFVLALTRSVRVAQLYGAGNPVYQRLIANFRRVIASALERAVAIDLMVEEAGLRSGDRLHSTGEGRDTIAFTLYKDGIRRVSFAPGFEDELDRFIAVMARARDADPEGDDLITLLWEEEFTSFSYWYVEPLTEEVLLPDHPVDLPGMRLASGEELIREARAEAAAIESGGASDVASLLMGDEQQATLYFLDDRERDQLEAQVRIEWERDLRAAVVDALFDRLEDSPPERQSEILDILTQWLPILLGRGDYAAATAIVRELGTVLGSGVLGEAQAAEAERTFQQLSEPDVLGQIIRLLEEGHVPGEDLPHYFAHLRANALPTLVVAVERFQSGQVAERIREAVDALAIRHPDDLVELLRADDPDIVTGTVRLIGRLGLGRAAPELVRLLGSASASLRLAAVHALARIPSGASVEGLQRALDDVDRDVRVAAVRSLADLRYQPARARIEATIRGPALKSADLTEKLAFFEAFARLGGTDAVPLLDQILNGKGFLGRRAPSELRACAAMALGHVGQPTARSALERAAAEDDPVVRTAVARALRGDLVRA